MAEVKKYIWIVPLIGGILAIVATILAPAASMNYMGMARDNLWMWGLYDLAVPMVPEYVTHFVPDLFVMIASIIATLIIVVSGVLLLIFALVSRKGSRLKLVRNMSIIAGVLIIAGETLWLIMVPRNFPFHQYTFWSAYPGTFWKLCYGVVCLNMHSVGFGIIGGFLAAGLAFLAVGLATYYSKERADKPLKAKEPVVPSGKQETVTKTELLFCSECGAKIEDPNLKFCGKCGHEI